MSDPFIGQIQIFPYNFSPRNWAYCDGSQLQLSQFTTLFAIIGTTYGGDGRTTLGLPNLSKRAPMGQGRAPALSTRILGQQVGAETETLVSDQMPAHTHLVLVDEEDGSTNDPSAATFSIGGVQGRGGFRAQNFYSTSTVPNVKLANSAIGNTGSSGAHENRQPFLGLSFCIALEGLFPSRN